METVEKKTYGKDVLDCVREQQRLLRTVTRELVADILKIPQYVADFHLKKLVNDGSLIRVKAGVYAVDDAQHSTRPISTTILPDGILKIEIGDCVLDLNQNETLMLSRFLCGFSIEKHLTALQKKAPGNQSSMAQPDIRLVK